jgi:glycosyltransferase involved in cell wall biosynthesis
MLLSIITINYNNLSGLEKTIQSVLNQTLKNFEFIIIDGGSTDGSKEYNQEKNEFIDCWVSESDNGIYHAMNKGIKMAKGEYCLFLNSGDYLVDSEVSKK